MGQRYLTNREVSIVRLVAQAKSNKQIAYELGLTMGTVKVYLSRIYDKLAFTHMVEGNPRVLLAQWVTTVLGGSNGSNDKSFPIS